MTTDAGDVGFGVDALGTRHARHADPATLRIVSLVPSLTELLCELGLADRVVGRTGFCIHPADAVASIPKVGGTKDVNVAKIRALAPTHVVVNVDENTRSTADTLATFVPHVVVTHPVAPRDNLALYRLFGHVFDRAEAADALCARFEAAWAALTNAPRPLPQRVLYLIWKDPWMTIARDTYIARMLETIGWRQVDVDGALDATVASSARYPAIKLVQALDGVDRVLLSTEPYRFGDDHVAALAAAGPRVQLVDGESLSWYGSRAIAGLGYLERLMRA